ncbi:MAG: hypothetical protein C0P68_004180 [Bacillota bacterium]|nr:hypothetical protein [Bacillota bacterium]
MWAIPLLAFIISLALTADMARQYWRKRQAHQLAYAAGLALFSLAVLTEFIATAFGWSPWMYKLYYYTGIVLVPVLASGSVFLLRRKGLALVFFLYVLVTALLMLLQLIVAPVDVDRLPDKGLTVGGSAMSEAVRQYSFWLSGVGGIVLLAVSLYSFIRTRYWGNLFIFFGALVMSAGGRLAVAGLPALLPLSELVGIILLYIGVARHPGSRRQTARSMPDA